MKTTTVDRDERTVAIENASYRWAYLFLSFGILAIVAFRSFAMGHSSWDLITLVVLSGVVTAAFRGRQQALTASASRSAVLAILGGILVATMLSYASQATSAARAGFQAARQAADSSR